MNKFTKIASLLTLGAVSALNAAPLVATDVDTSTAVSDIALVFLALLSVSIIIYGYRKVMGLVGR